MTTPLEPQTESADSNRSANRFLASGLAGASIGSAALVGGLLLVPGIAGAQDDTEPEAPTEESPTTADDETGRPNVLEDLTEEGVITQEQADTIRERFAAHREEFGGRRGGGGRLGHKVGVHSEAVTDLLGLTAEEIHAGFQNGQTLADLAEAQGVSTDALVDAIVAETEAHVAERLEAGDITQERADAILTDIEEKVEERVTTARPIRERGERRGGRRGHAANDGSGADTDADPDA